MSVPTAPVTGLPEGGTEETPVVTPPEDARLLSEAIGAGFAGHVWKNGSDLYLLADSGSVIEALTVLRDRGRYDYFVECMGVDYSAWDLPRDLPGRFEVVYNLFSTARNARIFLKTSVDLDVPLPTAKGVYTGAEYPEKEIGDMFGIRILGNELDPAERFLLPDDWVGYPLRKETPLGGEDVLFDKGYRGPAVEDLMVPHAGESFEGRTGSEDVSGR